MFALLLAAAIGQVDDVDDLRERWEVAELILDDELAGYAKSCRERYHAIQREPNEARKSELSDELEAYKREVSPLLIGIMRTVDKMRLKYLRASGGVPREAA